MNRANRSAAAMFTPVLAALLALAAVWPAVAADEGQLAFNNHCRTCHTMKEGDNRLGPSLHKIFGAKAGSASGYPNYSDALRNSGITWNEETLDKFIADPDSIIPNNNMNPYTSLTDAAVRKKIIEYLKSQSG